MSDSLETLPSGSRFASRTAAAVRRYEDPFLVERTWRRLEANRRRRPFVQWGSGVVACCVLLGLGFAGGRLSQGPTARRVLVAPAAAGIEGERLAEVRSSGEPSLPVTEEPAAELSGDPSQARALQKRLGRVVERAEFSPPGEVIVEGEIEAEPGRPEWLILADRGDFAGAFQELDRSNLLEAVIVGGGAEELMTLADVARFAGRTGWAIQALREVTRRYSGDANAPIAAMMLGNLLSRAGDAEGASRAYALNRRLSPEGDFAEDALVREFGMACAASERDRAARLLSEYEKSYPGGRHLAGMQAALQELSVAQKLAPGTERDVWGEGEAPGWVAPLEPSRDESSGSGGPPAASDKEEPAPPVE